MYMQEQIDSHKILVIGDCMLDEYNWGEVSRVSPESCCPILKKTFISYSCGGAANVAYQLQHIGCNVLLAGIIGNDDTGNKLKELLKKNIDIYLYVHKIKTTRKIRFINNVRQQMFRVDEEEYEVLTSEDLLDIKQRIEVESKHLKCIVISDYNKGVLTPFSTQEIINYAHKLSIPVVIDIKEANIEKYYEADLVKGNFIELCNFFPSDDINKDNVGQYALKLKERLKANYVVITLGQDGMVGISNDNIEYRVKAYQLPVYDVTGAGDVVTAFLAAYIDKLEYFPDVLNIANKAASIKVGKFGNIPVSISDIFSCKKIVTVEELMPLICNSKVVFTNGCFDILHAGHVNLLQKAKDLGDILVVGLNSDTSVKRIKGDKRPINSQEDRIEVLSGLQSVDYIVLFDEDTPLKLIESIKPSILVKGGDYLADEIVGADFVKNNNGEVITIPFVHFTSTTKILSKL